MEANTLTIEEEKRNLCTSEMKYGVGAKPRLVNSVLPGFTRTRGAPVAAKPPLRLLAVLEGLAPSRGGDDRP